VHIDLAVYIITCDGSTSGFRNTFLIRKMIQKRGRGKIQLEEHGICQKQRKKGNEKGYRK
jgi:hypothetical protein